MKTCKCNSGYYCHVHLQYGIYKDKPIMTTTILPRVGFTPVKGGFMRTRKKKAE